MTAGNESMMQAIMARGAQRNFQKSRRRR